jgi:hypothetical protein
VRCDRYLEEWAHAEKLAAISRRRAKTWADGLEGRIAKRSDVGPLRSFLTRPALLVRLNLFGGEERVSCADRL